MRARSKRWRTFALATMELKMSLNNTRVMAEEAASKTVLILCKVTEQEMKKWKRNPPKFDAKRGRCTFEFYNRERAVTVTVLTKLEPVNAPGNDVVKMTVIVEKLSFNGRHKKLINNQGDVLFLAPKQTGTVSLRDKFRSNRTA